MNPRALPLLRSARLLREVGFARQRRSRQSAGAGERAGRSPARRGSLPALLRASRRPRRARALPPQEPLGVRVRRLFHQASRLAAAAAAPPLSPARGRSHLLSPPPRRAWPPRAAAAATPFCWNKGSGGGGSSGAPPARAGAAAAAPLLRPPCKRQLRRDRQSGTEMAQETNQTPGPMLCSTGCGFYGNPRTNGMCSVCYKEHLQRQQNSGRISPMGTSSGSNSPTSDTASIQRADNSLNNCEGAAGSTSDKSRNVPVAALPVTQQMTEMSISREEKVTPKTETTEPVVTQPSPTVTVTQPSTSQNEEKTPEMPKPKKNRCFMCRKKVGLTGFDCRCGNLFCGLHRYSDKHNCPYDYKAEAAAKIRKENPVVVAEKIQRI